MMKVLVVDDNIDGAASLALYIQILGHEVIVAHDGYAALEFVTARRFDIVFLDIGLPGMTGYEVAQRARDLPHGRELVIVAATGWGTLEDKRKAAEAGCNMHLTKPIDLDEVERLLANGSDSPAHVHH